MRMEFTLKYIINSILLVFALSSVANAAPSRMNTTDTEPATCTVGDLWIDTNGTAGVVFIPVPLLILGPFLTLDIG